MKILWEPKSVLCWNLRTGIMICVIVRMILMSIGLLLCTTDILVIIHIHIRRNERIHPIAKVEMTFVLIIITGWSIALIFCGLLILGIKSNKPSMYVAFVVWQELEALVVLGFALYWLSELVIWQQIDKSFFFILILSGGILVYIQCFVLAIRAYHLEMKRLRPGEYVEYRGGEEEEAEVTLPVHT